VVLTISGVSGNAATRLESFVTRGGAFAFGSLPEVDDLFRRQAAELDRKKREALLFQLQRVLYEQVTQAPVYHLGFPIGVGPRVDDIMATAIPGFYMSPLRGPGAATLGYDARLGRLTTSRSQTPHMRYEAPESVEGAVALLAGAKGEARVLAGGTDLLVQMRADLVDPELIVDIKGIPETRAVSEEKGGWRIGAAVTGAELKEHPRLKKVWPGVIEAANLIGSTQIQGRATMGGNLCNGSPAADSVPALIAAGAIATLAGPEGKRDLPVEDVMLGPRKLALKKGEIVVSFLLPPRPPRSSDAYLRFIPRTEMDIAVVGAGVSLTLDANSVITAARVSLGAVAARVLLVPEAAQAIIGSRLDKPAQDRLEAAARAACRPIDDKRGTTEFRIDVAAVLVRRSALIALDRARNN
jgi:aerobic carbon-monoxide dehydrogenase medium subunit